MALDLDMTIDIDPGLSPLGIDIRGAQGLGCWFIEG
jgi:hypothetical protein